MKNKNFFITCLSLIPLLFIQGINVLASPTDLGQKSGVKVTSDGSSIVDPEDPDEVIPPIDPGPSTKGDLRIDYVSPLDFGKVKLDSKTKTFKALASKISKEGKARGAFIQISDFREKQTGWTLQVKQDYQFKTTESDELKGAILSLDKGWANAVDESNAPTVTRDTLSISNINQLYDVARADKGSGKGVWSINFGASKDNDDNQPVTIEQGKLTKEQINTAIRNSAVTITIPDHKVVKAKEYTTKISWVLSETP